MGGHGSTGSLACNPGQSRSWDLSGTVEPRPGRYGLQRSWVSRQASFSPGLWQLSTSRMNVLPGRQACAPAVGAQVGICGCGPGS